jgi:anti-sigma factor RsiW
MKITRNVIQDLLPAYVAGEVSADTRTLVEEWLRTDPDLSLQAEASRGMRLPVTPPPRPTIEKQALDRTRRHLRWQMVLLGTAIYVSSLPLTVTFNRSGFSGLLIDNWPERIVVIGIAIVLWISWWRLRRTTKVAGL